MLQVQRDHRPSYQQLFDRHQRAVYGFLLRRTRDQEQAAELFQETWLKVYRGRHTWKPQQAFRPWLFGIAANTRRDAGRKATRTLQTVEIDDRLGQSARRHAERMTLEAAIEALPDSLREAFLLGAVHGFDHREVAAQLDISPANARARISRARKALRESLAGGK